MAPGSPPPTRAPQRCRRRQITGRRGTHRGLDRHVEHRLGAAGARLLGLAQLEALGLHPEFKFRVVRGAGLGAVEELHDPLVFLTGHRLGLARVPVSPEAPVLELAVHVALALHAPRALRTCSPRAHEEGGPRHDAGARGPGRRRSPSRVGGGRVREEGPVGRPQSMPGEAKSPVRSQSPLCAAARLLRDGSKIV